MNDHKPWCASRRWVATDPPIQKRCDCGRSSLTKERLAEIRERREREALPITPADLDALLATHDRLREAYFEIEWLNGLDGDEAWAEADRRMERSQWTSPVMPNRGAA